MDYTGMAPQPSTHLLHMDNHTAIVKIEPSDPIPVIYPSMIENPSSISGYWIDTGHSACAPDRGVPQGTVSEQSGKPISLMSIEFPQESDVPDRDNTDHSALLPTNQDSNIPRPCYDGIDEEDMMYLTPRGLGIPPSDTARHVTTESMGSATTKNAHGSSYKSASTSPSVTSSEQAVASISGQKARRLRRKERQRQKKMVAELSKQAADPVDNTDRSALLPMNQDSNIPRPCYDGINEKEMRYLTPQGLGIPPSDTARLVTTESMGSATTQNIHQSYRTSSSVDPRVVLATAQSMGSATTQNIHQSYRTSSSVDPRVVLATAQSMGSATTKNAHGSSYSCYDGIDEEEMRYLTPQGLGIPPSDTARLVTTESTGSDIYQGSYTSPRVVLATAQSMGSATTRNGHGSSYKLASTSPSVTSSEQAVAGRKKTQILLRRKERQRKKKMVAELSKQAANPVVLLDELVKILPLQGVSANYLSGQEPIFDIPSHPPPAEQDRVPHQLKFVRHMHVSESLSSRSVSPEVTQIDPSAGNRKKKLWERKSKSKQSVNKRFLGNKDQRLIRGKKSKSKPYVKKKSSGNEDPSRTRVKQSRSQTSVNTQKGSSGDPGSNLKIDLIVVGETIHEVAHVQSENTRGLYSNTVFPVSLSTGNPSSPDRRGSHSVTTCSSSQKYPNTFPKPSLTDNEIEQSGLPAVVSVQEDSTARPQGDVRSGELILPVVHHEHSPPNALVHTDRNMTINPICEEISTDQAPSKADKRAVSNPKESTSKVTNTRARVQLIDEHSLEVHKAYNVISHSQTDTRTQRQANKQKYNQSSTKNSNNSDTASQTARQEMSEQVPHQTESVGSRLVPTESRVGDQCYMAARDEDDGLFAFPPPTIDLSKYQAPRGVGRVIFVTNQGDKVPQECYQLSRQSAGETSRSDHGTSITRDQTEESTTKPTPLQRHPLVPAQVSPQLSVTTNQPDQLSVHHTAVRPSPDITVQPLPRSVTRPRRRQMTLLPHTESDEEFLYGSEPMEYESSMPPLRLESPSSSQLSDKGVESPSSFQLSDKGAESPVVEPRPNVPTEDNGKKETIASPQNKQPQNAPVPTCPFDRADLFSLPQKDLNLIEVAVYETSISPELTPEPPDPSVVGAPIAPSSEPPDPSVVGAPIAPSSEPPDPSVVGTPIASSSRDLCLSQSQGSKGNDDDERLPNVPQNLTNSQQSEINKEPLAFSNSQTSSENTQNEEHFTFHDSEELLELLKKDFSSLIASTDWATRPSKNSKLKRKMDDSSEGTAAKKAKVLLESRTGLERETDLRNDDVSPYRGSPSYQDQSDGEFPSHPVDSPKYKKAVQQNVYELRPRTDSSRNTPFITHSLSQTTGTNPGDGSRMTLRHSQPVNYAEPDSLDYDSEEIDIIDDSFDDVIGEAPSIIIQSDSETDLSEEDQNTSVLEANNKDALHFAIEHSVNSNDIRSRETGTHTEDRSENETRNVYSQASDLSEMILIPSSDDNMSQSSQTSIVLIGEQPVATQNECRVSIIGASPVERREVSNTDEIRRSATNSKGAGFTCDTCQRSFRRRQDIARHRCVTTRLKRKTCPPTQLSLPLRGRKGIILRMAFFQGFKVQGDDIKSQTPEISSPQRPPKSHLFKTVHHTLDSQTESDSSVFEIPSTPMPGSHDQSPPPDIPPETRSSPLSRGSKIEQRRSKTRSLKLRKNVREVVNETDETGELTFGTPQHSQPAYQEGQRSYMQPSIHLLNVQVSPRAMPRQPLLSPDRSRDLSRLPGSSGVHPGTPTGYIHLPAPVELSSDDTNSINIICQIAKGYISSIRSNIRRKK